MGWITKALGLTLKVPTAGTKNWADGYLADFVTKISEHDHTGSPKGLQIAGGAIASGAITPVKFASSAYPLIFNRGFSASAGGIENTIKGDGEVSSGTSLYIQIRYGFVAPRDLTIKSLIITGVGSAASMSCPVTVKLYKNGVDTGISCSITVVDNTTLVTDEAAANVSVTKGDVLAFTEDTDAGTNGVACSVTALGV